MDKKNINQNPMPEIHLFPHLEAIGHFIKKFVSFCPLTAPDPMSDHYREHPLDTPIEPVTSMRNQWDSLGDYSERSE